MFDLAQLVSIDEIVANTATVWLSGRPPRCKRLIGRAGYV
jgi:hypothetical protein